MGQLAVSSKDWPLASARALRNWVPPLIFANRVEEDVVPIGQNDASHVRPITSRNIRSHRVKPVKTEACGSGEPTLRFVASFQ